jgi:hypothetical protein
LKSLWNFLAENESNKKECFSVSTVCSKCRVKYLGFVNPNRKGIITARIKITKTNPFRKLTNALKKNSII